MIGQVRRHVREHGIRATIGRVSAELCRQVFGKEEIILLVKDLDSVAKPRRRPDLEVVPLDHHHLAGLSKLNVRRGRSGVDRRFRDNMARGLSGFVGLLGDEIVGYYWWIGGTEAHSHPDFEWLGGALRIGVGDVYGSDFYLLPEVRGSGVGNEFLHRVETALGDRGYERIWSYVDRGNARARWLYSSHGYRPTADLSVRRILFRRRCAVKSTEWSVAAETGRLGFR